MVYRSALFAAAARGDAETVALQLSQYPISNEFPKEVGKCIDHRRRNVLHIAVEHGYYGVFKAVMTHRDQYHDIDFAAKDCAGFTVLHLAAEFGRDKMMRKLLCRFAIRDAVYERTDQDRLTCLDLAVIGGHVEIVKRLLATGYHCDLGSALRFAFEYSHENIVPTLLEFVRSARIDLVASGLVYAISSGNNKLAIQLLDLQPALMYGEITPGKSLLLIAAQYQRHELLARMCNHRAYLTDVGDGCGVSVLHLMAEHGYDAVVRQLLVAKPHLIDIVRNKGKRVLHIAAQNGHEKVVAELLAVRPALARQKDDEGRIALHLAAFCGQEQVVAEVLTRNRRVIDIVDQHGKTALFLAIQGAQSKPTKSFGHTVACLLTHKPAVVDQEMLWAAFDSEDPAIVKLLLEHKPALGQSVHSRQGTALHRVFELSARFGEDLTRMIWQMNPEAVHVTRNRDGKCRRETPFLVAVRRDNKFAMELVLHKLSLDETLDSFVECEKTCPQSLLDKHREPLVEFFHKDVGGIVFDYLKPSHGQKCELSPTAEIPGAATSFAFLDET